MVCMRCEHPVEEGARYCPYCGAPVEQGETPGWKRLQAERLLREAMSLHEQGRYEEALLACEGALAFDPQLLPALSLKALLHEKRGQLEQAIETYERVVQLNPLSVSERLKLDTLRRQPRAAVRYAPVSARPLWVEILPTLFAFIGAGVVLLIGLMMILRLSAPHPAPAPPTPVASAPSPTEPAANSSAAVASPPPPAPSESTSAGGVPPVMVDPSRLAIAPAPEETRPAPRGAIPTLPAPSNTSPPSPANPPQNSNSAAAPGAQGDNIMPDVEVRENADQGVYDIRVQKGAPPTQPSNPSGENPLEVARRHQMAGNYREAIRYYEQALPTAPSQGEVHQQIAICYLRLDDKANARAHFQLAIQAYQQEIQRGTNVDAAREGIRACEQGLKLCE